MTLTVEMVQRRAMRLELLTFLLLYDDVGQMQNEDNTVRRMYGRATAMKTWASAIRLCASY
jgi:hypothetical protein